MLAHAYGPDCFHMRLQTDPMRCGKRSSIIADLLTICIQRRVVADTIPRKTKQEWRDSNPRPAVLETAALPN